MSLPKVQSYGKTSIFAAKYRCRYETHVLASHLAEKIILPKTGNSGALMLARKHIHDVISHDFSTCLRTSEDNTKENVENGEKSAENGLFYERTNLL